MRLNNILTQYKSTIHPLFQPDLNRDNTLIMDFSADNPEMKKKDFNDIEGLNSYVFEKIKMANKKYGYGGYMENREIYRRSPLFAISPDDARSIHLGIDVWTEAGRLVYCPLDAVVHSYQNNKNYGDYGPTIILEHSFHSHVFYTLYGHLSIDSLEGLYKGKAFARGEVFCTVGKYPENGEWPPHLHFQVITDMMGKTGDFPGVCSKDEVDAYLRLCPDPLVFFDL